MAKRKNFIPSGKSKIRVAILSLLQEGKKSLATSQKNVTKKHIEEKLGNFPKLFTPAILKSGAKFVLQIRDDSRVDGKVLFPKGKDKYNALSALAETLRTTCAKMSRQYRYMEKADEAAKKAKRSIHDKVMYQIPNLWVVQIETANKKHVLGGYPDASGARSAARSYMRGMKKAYDPLIPVAIEKKNKKDQKYTTRAKLKIESDLVGRGVGGANYEKTRGRKGDAGEAIFYFAPGAALDYLVKDLKKPKFLVEVIKITSKEKHRGYWKLFDSPATGKMVWNPRR